MTPRVVVLMAVFNGEQVLDRALSSIHTQSQAPYAVVVVDDGSTDATFSTLEAWRGRLGEDRLVLLRSSRNRGLTHSLNAGIEAIYDRFGGGWDCLARIDADDEWLAGKPDAGVCACGYVESTPGGEVVGEWCPPEGVSLRELLGLYNPFAHSSLLIRREALERAGGYDETFVCSQDYDLLVRVARDWEITAVPRVLVRRWRGPGGVGATRIRRQKYDSMRARLRAWRILGFDCRGMSYMARDLLCCLLPPAVVSALRRLKDGKRFT